MLDSDRIFFVFSNFKRLVYIVCMRQFQGNQSQEKQWIRDWSIKKIWEKKSERESSFYFGSNIQLHSWERPLPVPHVVQTLRPGCGYENCRLCTFINLLLSRSDSFYFSTVLLHCPGERRGIYPNMNGLSDSQDSRMRLSSTIILQGETQWIIPISFALGVSPWSYHENSWTSTTNRAIPN